MSNYIPRNDAEFVNFLTWTPLLYGHDASNRLLGAAWLLWGVGVIIVFAFVASNRFAQDVPVAQDVPAGAPPEHAN